LQALFKPTVLSIADMQALQLARTRQQFGHQRDNTAAPQKSHRATTRRFDALKGAKAIRR
jgi:hypothetical protein